MSSETAPLARRLAQRNRMLALVVLGLAVGLLWFGLVRPLRTQAALQETAIAQRQTQLTALEREASAIDELRQQLAAIQEHPERRRLFLPEEAAGETLRASVQSSVESAGLSLDTIEILPPGADRTRTRRISVRLHALGDLAQVQSLIHGIESDPRALRVDNLYLRARSQASKTQPLDLQMDVVGFTVAEGSN